MTDAFDRLKAALADRYTIEREIGRGGMATVYLAEEVTFATSIVANSLQRKPGGEKPQSIRHFFAKSFPTRPHKNLDACVSSYHPVILAVPLLHPWTAC